MGRQPGMSVRLKLTLSYAAFLTLAGTLLLAAVWVFLLRYVPERAVLVVPDEATTSGGVFPVRSRLLDVFAPRAAGVFVLLLAFGLLGGWILAGRMLAPLTRITNATRLAENGSLSHRIELEGPTDEFRELADGFDRMLAQLQEHVAQHQRFAANASHELRTPLAITQTLLDVAINDPDRDSGDLDERLRAINTRAINLTEALLLLSRADQRSFTEERVDLSLIAEEATETLLPFADKRGITIETSSELTPTTGSHALLLQLATNLVHNAIVHNLPAHGTICVTTAVRFNTVVLTVENTGEILGRQLVSTLTEPFQRGTRTHQPGVGLGLAIVKSITEAHNGTLNLIPRLGGGLQVTVQLPYRELEWPPSAVSTATEGIDHASCHRARCRLSGLRASRPGRRAAEAERPAG
ncbi:sensor histidine kinase [Kribbella sp. NPDC051586]|uniref:sensor histidine kinase n=1 Tax=Kribbella sp. NPDC051586 TaxID=3364118 RepID=UPI0037A35015